MKRLFAIAIPLLVLWGCGTENNPTFKLTTTVSPVGAGTILPTQTTFDKGEIAVLEAVPTNGWKFIRWEGDLISTVNPVNLGMTKDYNIIGIFERRDYPLTVNVEGQGSVTERVVTAKTTDYPFETIVELTPIAAEGWVFKEWSGDLSGSQSPTRITVSGAKSVTAKFERRNYALSVTVEGQGSVTETVVPQKSTDYPFQTVVQLTPVPSEGWIFVEWTGDLTGNDAPKSITVDKPKSVVAKFERRNYALTVTVEGQGSVTERVVLAKSTDYPFETIVELTPIASLGWAFKEWDGDLSGSQSPARITLTGPKSVVARFMTSPTVSSGSVSNLSASGATVGGNVTSDGGNDVTSRGVCYSTTQNPTTAGMCVAAGTGTGAFTVDLTGLSSGTLYYVRAYATNSVGTRYGTQASFTTWTTPSVSTGSVSSLTATSVTLAGNVTSDGGSPVTARGVCYATTQNPTLSDTCVESGNGTGSFTSNLSGLSLAMTYYVRAYATNSVGTSYGSQSSFTTYFNEVSDIDGNIYPMVQIGTQVWMASNLKTSRYRDGSMIPNVTGVSDWSNLANGAWVNNENNIGYDDIYGKLYNWYAVADSRNICPVGWHVPSVTEWTALSNHLGTEPGHKMKATSGWDNNGNGSDISGFNGRPGGYRNSPINGGTFSPVGSTGLFWSSSEHNTDNAWNQLLHSGSRDLHSHYNNKKHGFSVRCVMD